MAETLANGTVVPQGSDLIHTSGVQAVRNLGGSVDARLGAKADTAEVDAQLSMKADTTYVSDELALKADTAEVDAALGSKADSTHVDQEFDSVNNRITSQRSDLLNRLGSKADTAEVDARLDGIATAYDVAQAEGFTGTLTDWLESLIGPRGPEGPYGGTEVTDPQVASWVTTPSETRTVLDAGYRRGVSVLEYGATGDGETDDSTAFQAALDSGQSVHVPAGTYRVSGVVTTQPVDLELARGAILDHQETGACITVTGSEATAAVPVTADVPRGAMTVTAPGHGLTVDDWARLGSEDIWDQHSTGIRQGELIRVGSVDGDDIEFATPVQGDYTLDGAVSLWKLDLVPKVSVHGAGMIRGARTPDLKQTGLLVRLARNVTVENIDMYGFDYRHVAMEDVADWRINGVDFEWAQDSGQAYAVAATNASQDFIVTGCTFTDVRHCFTTSNLSAVRGITRRGTVSTCVSRRTLRALGGSMGGGDAFDTHTASDDITFENLMIIAPTGGGVNMEGRTGHIRYCTIIDPGNRGIDFHNESDRNGMVEIVGNLVARPRTYGIRVAPPNWGAESTLEGVLVSGNTVVEAGSTPIYIGANNGNTLYGVSVHNNFGLRNTNAYLIRAHNVARVKHSGNNSVGSSRDIQVTDLEPDVITVDPGFRIDTISDGVATVTPETRYLRLGATATDTLTRIDGGVQGQIIIVRLSSASSSAQVIPGSGGNMKTASPLTLVGTDDTLTLGFTGATWIEVSRAKF